MAASTDMKIAGDYTCGEWRALSVRLDPKGRLPSHGLDADWREAIGVISRRLETRYVSPLEAIKRFEYAGFLIVAIDSLLAEALQRVRKGWRLKENKSSELVISFLRERPRFGTAFQDSSHRQPYRTCPCVACDFYRNVRSGIVHEGEAQGGWRIRFGRRYLVERRGTERILDRDRFHLAVTGELRDYLVELTHPGADELRGNLRATLDGICV